MAGDPGRGAARLRGAGELRGLAAILPRSPWCLHGAPPQPLITAGVRRVLLRVGEAFPGKAERIDRDRGDKRQGDLLLLS